MTITLYRDVWAMCLDAARLRFPRPVLVPAGTHEAMRIANPFIRSGEDFLVVKVGADTAGMTETGWIRKAGRPRPRPVEHEQDWSF